MKDEPINRVGFIRTDGEYCPVFTIADRPGYEPSKIVYLDSPSKRYIYELKEVQPK